ncbi:MAG TPA: hypothetical protein VGP31_06655 [Planosporangium sp.]|jgi:hypothetical protein|nr:hypothetical protein [Planosporangium sp.]
MRTLVLLLAAIGTAAEALLVGAVLYVLGDVIGAYSMSMGGLPAGHGQAAVWILGAVLAVVLAAPAVPLVMAAVRGRPFGRPARTLIISALVLQGILGVVVELTAGGPALLGVLAVFSLLLLSLVTATARRSVEAGAAPVA